MSPRATSTAAPNAASRADAVSIQSAASHKQSHADMASSQRRRRLRAIQRSTSSGNNLIGVVILEEVYRAQRTIASSWANCRAGDLWMICAENDDIRPRGRWRRITMTRERTTVALHDARKVLYDEREPLSRTRA